MNLCFSEEITPFYQKNVKSLVSGLLEEYEHLEKELKEKKKELDRIYKQRPSMANIPQVSPHGEYLLVFQYYRENLMACLKAMSDLEENLKDIENRLSAFTPTKGKFYHRTKSGASYVYGFIKFHANDRRFFLRKLSADEKFVPVASYLSTSNLALTAS
ncbi:MAG: hypothetical protein M3Q05_12190 [Bacteroidota bacterium]|nr:hypothetical protein [Bacteroidota bacterium]